MNVAFFHDSVFIKKGKDYYTSGTLNNELFAMYQQNFKNISIVTRYKDFDETQNSKIKESNKITLENINFRCVKNYKNALETVKKEIIKCDFAIIRCHSIVGTIAAYYAIKYNKKFSWLYECSTARYFIKQPLLPFQYEFEIWM